MILIMPIMSLILKIFFNTVLIMLNQQQPMNSFILIQTEVLKNYQLKALITKDLLLVKQS